MSVILLSVAGEQYIMLFNVLQRITETVEKILLFALPNYPWIKTSYFSYARHLELNQQDVNKLKSYVKNFFPT